MIPVSVLGDKKIKKKIIKSNKSKATVYSDGYDSEFYGDEKDRENLQAMNQIEREKTIASRQEQREER